MPRFVVPHDEFCNRFMRIVERIRPGLPWTEDVIVIIHLAIEEKAKELLGGDSPCMRDWVIHVLDSAIRDLLIAGPDGWLNE